MTYSHSRALDAGSLFSLARDKSPESRVSLAQQMVGLFESQSTNLSDREADLMSDILTKLVSDMELKVRQSLSEQLSRSSSAPKDLLSMLANDEYDVAKPILLNCGLLNDAELIEIIRHRALEHQLAVALRPNISKEISAALVETKDESVILNLLQNHGAQISDSTMEYLVEESRRVDSYREPLVTRPELSRDLAKRMCLWVSAAIREFILQRFQIKAAEIDQLLSDAVDEITSNSDDEANSKSDDLAQKLQDAGRLTVNVLISLLQDGQVAATISGLGKLTGLNKSFIKRALFDPWGDALVIILRAIAANKDHLTIMYRLTRNASPAGHQGGPENLQGLIQLFESTTQASAGQLIRQWSRDPNYFAAVQQIQAHRPQNG